MSHSLSSFVKIQTKILSVNVSEPEKKPYSDRILSGLLEQQGMAVKTIQEIEKGRKNATYETLSLLIERLGISANTLFQTKTSINDEAVQRFIGKFQSCTLENQEILLCTLDFLSEQLLTSQHKSQNSK